MSSLIYECESWIEADMKPMVELDNWCLKKLLLGVRKCTCSDICYVESGYLALPDLVKYRQHKCISTEWQERSQYDDPLALLINIVQNSGTCSTSRLVKNFINEAVTPLSEAMVNVIDGIRQNDSSRKLTYKYINPEVDVHKVYKERYVHNK